METGYIKSVVVERGFGFIKPDAGGPDIFFHLKAISGLPWSEQLQQQRVTFDTEQQPDGRLRATWVRPA